MDEVDHCLLMYYVYIMAGLTYINRYVGIYIMAFIFVLKPDSREVNTECCCHLQCPFYKKIGLQNEFMQFTSS